MQTKLFRVNGSGEIIATGTGMTDPLGGLTGPALFGLALHATARAEGPEEGLLSVTLDYSGDGLNWRPVRVPFRLRVNGTPCRREECFDCAEILGGPVTVLEGVTRATALLPPEGRLRLAWQVSEGSRFVVEAYLSAAQGAVGLDHYREDPDSFAASLRRAWRAGR